MISAILAATQNNVIGYRGVLPWHIPEDLARFRNITMGHSVIMGRKTFESLPDKYRPLPGRKNYVLSRDKHFIEDWANCVDKKYYILSGISSIPALFPSSDEVFIIGGAAVFEEAFRLNIIQTVYLTVIHEDVIGDTYFNVDYLLSNWNHVSEDCRDGFTFYTLNRGISNEKIY